MSFRGGRGGGAGDGHVRTARGAFTRERLAPRGWSPSQRNDVYSRPSNTDAHFNSAGSRNSRPNLGGGGGNNVQQQQQQQQQKDRKMKMGQREDNRPRHVRTSMDR